jgi:hypothetical protein
LLFLIDTGADISILKGNKLVGSTEFDHNGRMKVRCVDGSTIDTHGVIKAKIRLGSKTVTHNFQLVGKQVDIPCDGILGRDLFNHTKARICYKTRAVLVNGERCKMVEKPNSPREGESRAKTVSV